MAKQTSTAATGSVGFLGLLTLAFVVLKLTSVISWSWWWVLAPLWLPTLLSLLVFIAVLMYVQLKMKRSNEGLHKW